MRHLRALVLLLIESLLLVTIAPAADLWRIAITDTAFVPVRTDSFRGDTLRWVNASPRLQSIKTGSVWHCEQYGPLDLGDIASGDSLSYVVDFGGTGEFYTYFSSYNCPGPEGVLTVGPEPSILPTSWGKVRSLYR